MLIKKSTVIIFVCSLALMMADCRCQKQRVTLKSVILELPHEARGFSEKLDREKLYAVVKKTIEQNAHFNFDQNYRDENLLRLSFQLPKERLRTASILLLGSLTLAKNDLENEFKSFADIKVVDGNVSGAEISQAVDRVLKNLYERNLGIAAGNDDYVTKIEVAAGGQAIDQSELINAISVVSDSKEKKAIPALRKLLASTSDFAIGNACIIALGELEADEAMTDIIEFVERKPPIIRRQAIIAAKRIGSRLAAEWLLVMAYGHEDDMVRKEALDALGQVEEKLSLKDQ